MFIRFRHLAPDPQSGTGASTGDGAAPAGASGAPGSAAGTQTGSGPTGTQNSDQGAGTAPGTTGGAGGTAPEPQDVSSLPQWAQDHVRSLRTENAGHRQRATAAEAQTQAIRDAAKVALGLAEAPSADQLGEQLRASQAETRTARIETAIARSAGGHGADPGRLLDRVSFLRPVEALDPTAADFSTRVDDAIKAAVAADPTVRLAPLEGAGGQQNGGARRPAPDSSQGSSGSGNGGAPKTVQAGRDLYRQRHPAQAST